MDEWDWFYATAYGNIADGRATKKDITGNLAQWIIAQPKCFTENDIEKVSRSVQLYIYLDLISQVQTMSSIVGSSVSTVAARCFHKQLFFSTLPQRSLTFL